GATLTPITESVTSQPPNILLVIADDFGVDASPCYDIGAEKPNMPNLESLCKSGVVFDNAWATPACSSTRAAILTGQYGFRTGVLAAGDTLQDTESIQDILANDVPIPYSNAVIGKWHVGGKNPDPNHPAQFGVQHYAGFLTSGLKNYYDWSITEDGVTSEMNEYATTVFTDKAIDWVAQQQQPWFLWLAYNAPHVPNHLPPSDLHTNQELTGTPKDIRNNPREYYFAAAEALDAEMGRLLNSLTPETRAHTIVIFIGDNGTHGSVSQTPVDPERAKFTVYEGGVRVPLIIAGGGVTRQNQHEDALINVTDLFSTIAHLAGYPNDARHDSLSFKDALTDPGFVGRDYAYTEFRHDNSITVWAVRNRQYKLIEYSDGRKELFDLSVDPFENNNLIASGISDELNSVIQELENYVNGL
ncbi:MAG: sulfatase-like hydrolase/transferase, partial [Anaerolineales bacterium]|nr:sulfatase-like hydrolase/transferase [Anaerolineales bacterium]